ncbi:Galactose mutarotase [Cohnella sp. OV330]|uniref:DUF4432 family protein n=1 Tax=Cohnella sp. OV330 TaxID=1855288 RepID=UPI0008E95634|nr:DUF4432 family protein [Cohnella sp. OV330]SFA81197.1 Galactose mutarotase [Cohnella sp. OV330]
MGGPCAAAVVAVNGIEGVRLENEWLSAVVLVGKGTDIWELTYKPLNLQLLMKTRTGLSLCEGRDLREKRLEHYAEGYPGGWQEILPNRASFDGGRQEVGRDREGESAGMPWDYAVEDEGGSRVTLRCRLTLPYTPLAVEKTISLAAGECMLRIAERVVNVGRDDVHFIWTHHPAFGSPLVGEGAEILLPKGSRAFNVLQYERERETTPAASFEEAVDAVRLPSGSKKDLRSVDPPVPDGEACYMPLKNLEEGLAGIYQPALNVKLLLEWDHLAFPCLRYWSNNDDDLYTVALEPSTSWHSDIGDCMLHGNCISLAPQEERRFWLNVRVEQP